MKILQLGKYYYPHMGGIETHLYLLSNGLKDKGNDTTIVVSNDSPKSSEETINDVKVYRYPKLFAILNAPIFFSWSTIENEDFDIIHLHLPNPFASLHALFKYKKNLVVTYHSDIIKSGIFAQILNFLYTNLVLHPLLKTAKKIIVTSPNYAEGSKILQKYTNKIKVVPYGIDLKLFSHNKVDKKILNKLHKKYHGHKVILFVGRLVPYKGLEYLIDAMPDVIRNFENVKLLIIGDGPLKQKLKELVNKLGLYNYIEFLPATHNLRLPPYYYLCDMLVLPSIYKAEAFGIVQLEAMACGKPIVSTNVFGSGISFVNKNNETGFVVQSQNSKELSLTIVRLLKNVSLMKRFGKNGKFRVKKYFSKDVMIKSILDIYNSILRHPKES